MNEVICQLGMWDLSLFESTDPNVRNSCSVALSTLDLAAKCLFSPIIQPHLTPSIRFIIFISLSTTHTHVHTHRHTQG